MPELPEVETIRRTLKELVLKKEIKSVSVYWPKIIKKPHEVEQFKDALKGQTILDIKRRGKFLLFITEIYVLVSHLRMEGRYSVISSQEEVDKHTHIIFHFTDDTDLRYRDVRKFGTMHLFAKGEEFDNPPLLSLGPEPFEENFSVKQFYDSLMKTRRYIKSALLDQTIVVGLGNIYVDEALFKAGIHPQRIAQTLSYQEVENLHGCIVETLSEAVKKGGSTVRTYVNSQGQMGMFQLEHNVYGRRGEACKICGTSLERIIVGGRGTVFCPVCQPDKEE